MMWMALVRGYVMRFSRQVLFATFVTTVAGMVSNVAFAANVTNVQGQVQLSRAGGAFQTITGPSVCNAGDTVRVVKNGSADVVNADGSIQSATPGKPIVCKAATAGLAPTTTPAAASAGAAGGAGAVGGAAAGVSTAVVAGGVVAVVGGVVGVVALTKKKSSASP
jgi:hypothetical protein